MALLTPISWSGVAFRHTTPGIQPLSGEGARQFGGRWNPPGRIPTLYMATSVACCVAEFERMAEGQGRGARSFLPRDLHEISVKDVELLDVTNPENRDVIELTEAAIREDDRGTCQLVGDVAHFLGFQGVLAPSATGVDEALALFELKVGPSQLEVVSTGLLELP